MDFDSNYEVVSTAEFIRSRGFTRVGLQFPDELREDATEVGWALRRELGGGRGVLFVVMADNEKGRCCVDELEASKINADCVVHYGHSCMSPTSTLPARFVFGKAAIDINACAESLVRCASNTKKPVLVLYGLEYAHALENIKELVGELLHSGMSSGTVHYAEVTYSTINPFGDLEAEKEQPGSHDDAITNGKLPKHAGNGSKIDVDIEYNLEGLTWNIAACSNMENYLIFWVGADNPAFSTVALTFNNCEIVRFGPEESQLIVDFPHQKRILKQRYYLVEKAKDANIVGILLGTHSLAGYCRIANQMKELIEGSGRRSYTFALDRPTPQKLANHPECDVYVYVSCAQTALLNSKEFLAPIITPFEAVLAFGRGQQWTGKYVMKFEDLMIPTKSEFNSKEARFSFIEGGYVEDIQPEGNGENQEVSSALAKTTEKALSLKNKSTDSLLYKGAARSASEFLSARTYQGLDPEYENSLPETYLIGRTGKASGYQNEKTWQEKLNQ